MTGVLTIGEVLQRTANRLRQGGIEEYQLESELLLADVLSVSRLQLSLKRRISVQTPDTVHLEKLIGERLKRIPLAYILKSHPFLDLSLHIDSSVLIPRPETELLAERAIKLLVGLHNAVVIDVGTGSGALALTLSQQMSLGKIIATDLSADALRVAKYNESRILLQPQILWLEGNLLKPVMELSILADMIIGNLPYIPSDEISMLSPEVRAEPHMALDGGPDGLSLIRECIIHSPAVLKPGGYLLLEIGHNQGPAVQKLLETEKSWDNIHIHKDWAGYDRIVQARKKEGI